MDSAPAGRGVGSVTDTLIKLAGRSIGCVPSGSGDYSTLQSKASNRICRCDLSSTEMSGQIEGGSNGRLTRPGKPIFRSDLGMHVAR